MVVQVGIINTVSTSRWPTVSKVKAHRSRKRAEQDMDVAEWNGNRIADQWAKDTATYDLVDNWQGKVKWFINRAKELLAAHVVIHNKYPPPPDKWWRRSTSTEQTPVIENHPAGAQSDIPPGSPVHPPELHQVRHRFMVVTGQRAIICGRCLNVRHEHNHKDGECQDISWHRSHLLHVAVADPLEHSVIVCRNCGKWAKHDSLRKWITQQCPPQR